MFKKITLSAVLALAPVFAQAAATVTDTPTTPTKPIYDGLKVAQTQAGFQQWIKTFRNKALSNGISARTYDQAFKGATLNTRVIKADRKQAEFSREIWDYL
ncbi:lytic murein transglycosylase, partial [Amylibacter sp.]|nr:lytic murein transglycosylase [Amylibacter sp.]